MTRPTGSRSSVAAAVLLATLAVVAATATAGAGAPVGVGGDATTDGAVAPAGDAVGAGTAAGGTALDAAVETVIVSGPTPAEVGLGDEFDVTVAVRNVGDAPSVVAEIRLFTPDGVRLVNLTRGVNLTSPSDPNSIDRVAFGFSTPPPGPGEAVQTTLTFRVGPAADPGRNTLTFGGHLNRSEGPTDNTSADVAILEDAGEETTTTTTTTTTDGDTTTTTATTTTTTGGDTTTTTTVTTATTTTTTTATTAADGTTGDTGTADTTADGDTTTTTTAADGTTDSGGQPGFGPASLVLALAAAVGVGLYRRRGRRD